VLGWYEPRRRAYPWRTEEPDPYRTLVSEVMLQQTQAARVVPAFLEFVRLFPSVGSLARARPSAVVRAWGSLGYPRRALNLRRAAEAMVVDHGGAIPRSPEALEALPGVGPYTAAAVASIAHGQAVPAVDTNVARVVARASLGAEPHRVGAKRITAAAADWLDPSRPGDWNQALMDLGREVCRPSPRCGICPLAWHCRFGRGDPLEGRRPRPRVPYPGSAREARGAVLRALRRVDPLTLASVASDAGLSRDRLVLAIRSLHRDGLIEASDAALKGLRRGTVRLAI
jgi:A/G-specific adenine glycosylase